MATMVVLVDGEAASVSLDVRMAAELTRLGVTSLSLVGDERTVGVVLEGWAFDPVSSGAAAVSALQADAARAQTLLPVGELALAALDARGASVTERGAT